MTTPHYNSRPILAVGLMSAQEVDINFISGFNETGAKHFSIADVKSPLMFTPITADSVFEVGGVTIGVGFHWQQ